MLFPDNADAVVGRLGLVVDGDDTDGDVEIALGGDAFRQFTATAIVQIEGDGDGAGLRFAAFGEDVDAVDLAFADEGLAFVEGDRQAGDGGWLVAAGGDDENAEEGGEDANAGDEHTVHGEGTTPKQAARRKASPLVDRGDAVLVVEIAALGHAASHPRETRPRVAESCPILV